MTKIKDVLRFLVSFILMFALIAMQLCFFINNRLLNGEFYKGVLNKSDYFSLMRKEIDFGFQNLSMMTSIPEDVFKNALSNSDYKNLSYINMESAESYMKYESEYIDNKVDTKVFSDSVKNYVENYAKENNVVIDDTLTSQMDQIISDAGNIVDNHAVLFNIAAVEKYPEFQKFRSVLHLIDKNTVTSIFVVAILMIILILLNTNRPRRSFLWIGSSFIPASIMMLVPSILALIYRIPYRFAVDTSYLKEALKVISMGYIFYFIQAGLMFLILGVCCMLIYTFLSNLAHEKRVARREKRQESYSD